MLKHGDKYKNIISNKVLTINKKDECLWYLEGDYGKGESCDEKEMERFLRSRFSKLDE